MNPAPQAAAAGAASRATAARAVETVLARGATLDDAFAELEPEHVAGPDRSQAKALAFGALRWHHRHLELLKLLLNRPLSADQKLMEALLSVGLFQLLDERQPDYATVSATVEAARWLGQPRAAGLVNATLRRFQRERAALMDRAMSVDAGRYSHPAWLVRRARQDWPDQWSECLEAAQQAPPLWLRVNLARQSRAAYLEQLQAAGLQAGAPAELPAAVKLARPLPVADIPGFSAGAVTVQDAASQLAVQLLGAAPGMRVLDACAAPGGKTTQLLEQAGGDLQLLALDIDARRLRRVAENLQRLGLAAELQVADAADPRSWWDGQPFDRILLDAPCSGTGVIRRHPDIKWLRRESDIAGMARRQLELLESLWPLLRPGGRLLYATCSVLREENDGVIGRFVGAHPDAALAHSRVPDWLAGLDAGGWQALPGTADTDGFYYALMTRKQV